MGLKRLHRYIVFLILATICVGGYLAWQKQQPIPPLVLSEEQIAEQAIIDEWYAPLFSMMIDSVMVQASVASTTETRTKGLSDTPHLPEDVVKLFVFDESQEWSFWMKDMNYPIDIIWVDATGSIVHIEESVSPASYPKSFVPNRPAKYVVETVAGFVKKYGVGVGDRVILPEVVKG
ncbi:MAG: DUF192 domain-containing protein [Candidatus Paceibacteria bacterium]